MHAAIYESTSDYSIENLDSSTAQSLKQKYKINFYSDIWKKFLF